MNSNLGAYLGTGSLAGDFQGNVNVNGKIFLSSGNILMDHPLDAANKFLCHSLVGSSDMKNIYDGIAMLDADGKAEIEFPNWF